jgi:hypothetical protein
VRSFFLSLRPVLVCVSIGHSIASGVRCNLAGVVT